MVVQITSAIEIEPVKHPDPEREKMIIDTDVKSRSKSSKSKSDRKLSLIKCIFFCEFHHKTGRESTYQVSGWLLNMFKSAFYALPDWKCLVGYQDANTL